MNLQLLDAMEAKTRLLETRSRFLRSEFFLPELPRAARAAARNQTAVSLGATACAVERYQIVKGKYPERLEDLIPEFIKEIPREVTSDEALRYHRTDDGRFALYSLGFAGKDFGGAYRNDTGRRSGDLEWQLGLVISFKSPMVKSNHFDRAFRQRINERLPVALHQNAVVQHHHDSLVRLRADQPAHALAEFQYRLWQRKITE